MIEATARTTTIGIGPGRSRLAPAIAATKAPATNDPSTPMLNTPARHAARVAVAVRMGGVDETRVAEIRLTPPKGSRARSQKNSSGDSPVQATTAEPTRRAAISGAAAAIHSFHLRADVGAAIGAAVASASVIVIRPPPPSS